MGEAYKFPSLLVHRIKVEIAPEKMRKASGEGKLMCGAGEENIKTGKNPFFVAVVPSKAADIYPG